MAEKIETIVMVEKAMTVLDLLRTSSEEMGVNEIAKICDCTPSTTHRILKTLEKYEVSGIPTDFAIFSIGIFVDERSCIALFIRILER